MTRQPMTTTHRFWRPAFAMALIAACGAAPVCTMAADFRGAWTWAIYTKDRSELPPAYRKMSLKDTPRDTLDLTIRQRGDRLRGEYGATANFLARVEDGRFTTTAQGDTARLRLVSGFGGHVTATVTRRGPTLIWKVVHSAGEEYFPPEAILRRVGRRHRFSGDTR